MRGTNANNAGGCSRVEKLYDSIANLIGKWIHIIVVVITIILKNREPITVFVCTLTAKPKQKPQHLSPLKQLKQL